MAKSIIEPIVCIVRRLWILYQESAIILPNDSQSIDRSFYHINNRSNDTFHCSNNFESFDNICELSEGLGRVRSVCGARPADCGYRSSRTSAWRIILHGSVERKAFNSIKHSLSPFPEAAVMFFRTVTTRGVFPATSIPRRALTKRSLAKRFVTTDAASSHAEREHVPEVRPLHYLFE